jgi:hypothetical protein
VSYLDGYYLYEEQLQNSDIYEVYGDSEETTYMFYDSSDSIEYDVYVLNNNTASMQYSEYYYGNTTDDYFVVNEYYLNNSTSTSYTYYNQGIELQLYTPNSNETIQTYIQTSSSNWNETLIYYSPSLYTNYYSDSQGTQLTFTLDNGVPSVSQSAPAAEPDDTVLESFESDDGPDQRVANKVVVISVIVLLGMVCSVWVGLNVSSNSSRGG